MKKQAQGVHFFPFLVLVSFFACASPQGLENIFTPPGQDISQSTGIGSETGSGLAMDLKFTLRPGTASPMPSLASARDDTISDSLHLYIDVAIENIGPEVVFLPVRGDSISLSVNVSFVDVPYKKHFSRGKLKLVTGWTETGLQASETIQYEFAADSSLHFSMPLSRIDSFHVADNVAVYGQVLSPGRFIIAKTVRRFDTPSPPKTTPAPSFVGYVKQVDLQNNRLYVSGATVVITDSTRIETPTGELSYLGALRCGVNRLTITALAWAYSYTPGVIANGWEFGNFSVIVAREPSP
jgi:hypothetical protein